jgi:hypothetical protein
VRPKQSDRLRPDQPVVISFWFRRCQASSAGIAVGVCGTPVLGCAALMFGMIAGACVGAVLAQLGSSIMDMGGVLVRGHRPLKCQLRGASRLVNSLWCEAVAKGWDMAIDRGVEHFIRAKDGKIGERSTRCCRGS